MPCCKCGFTGTHQEITDHIGFSKPEIPQPDSYSTHESWVRAYETYVDDLSNWRELHRRRGLFHRRVTSAHLFKYNQTHVKAPISAQ